MSLAYWMNSVMPERSTTASPQWPILVKWIQPVGPVFVRYRSRINSCAACAPAANGDFFARERGPKSPWPNRRLNAFVSACSSADMGGVLEDATAVWSCLRNLIGSFAISSSAIVLYGREKTISGRTLVAPPDGSVRKSDSV